MCLKISGGIIENGVVTGNAYDKYASRNPIVRAMMRGFDAALMEFVSMTQPRSIHEIGCGEGYWVLKLNQSFIGTGEDSWLARGCDFSRQIIEIARQNAVEQSQPSELFNVKSIYDLEPGKDSADMIICCEVLEHLEAPGKALRILASITDCHAVLSVPCEPLWRVLNMARGKYLAQLGNTPGHIQHWSKGGFVRLVEKYFDIVRVKSPLPWTMVLGRSKKLPVVNKYC
jgi:2-polyprenyl-3-methyl-5-hydroxy-6-metoxy-1,4-benzoquinol methylase